MKLKCFDPEQTLSYLLSFLVRFDYPRAYREPNQIALISTFIRTIAEDRMDTIKFDSLTNICSGLCSANLLDLAEKLLIAGKIEAHQDDNILLTTAIRANRMSLVNLILGYEGDDADGSGGVQDSTLKTSTRGAEHESRPRIRNDKVNINASGHTVFDVAVSKGNLPLLRRLLRDPRLDDSLFNKPKSITELAIIYNFDHIVRFLIEDTRFRYDSQDFLTAAISGASEESESEIDDCRQNGGEKVDHNPILNLLCDDPRSTLAQLHLTCALQKSNLWYVLDILKRVKRKYDPSERILMSLRNRIMLLKKDEVSRLIDTGIVHFETFVSMMIHFTIPLEIFAAITQSLQYRQFLADDPKRFFLATILKAIINQFIQDCRDQVQSQTLLRNNGVAVLSGDSDALVSIPGELEPHMSSDPIHRHYQLKYLLLLDQIPPQTLSFYAVSILETVFAEDCPTFILPCLHDSRLRVTADLLSAVFLRIEIGLDYIDHFYHIHHLITHEEFDFSRHDNLLYTLATMKQPDLFLHVLSSPKFLSPPSNILSTMILRFRHYQNIHIYLLHLLNSDKVVLEADEALEKVLYEQCVSPFGSAIMEAFEHSPCAKSLMEKIEKKKDQMFMKIWGVPSPISPTSGARDGNQS